MFLLTTDEFNKLSKNEYYQTNFSDYKDNNSFEEYLKLEFKITYEQFISDIIKAQNLINKKNLSKDSAFGSISLTLKANLSVNGNELLKYKNSEDEYIKKYLFHLNPETLKLAKKVEKLVEDLEYKDVEKNTILKFVINKPKPKLYKKLPIVSLAVISATLVYHDTIFNDIKNSISEYMQSNISEESNKTVRKVKDNNLTKSKDANK